jgi:hypothetical protein
MTDVLVAIEMEFAAAAGTLIAEDEPIPLSVIVYAAVALSAETLWLGLIGRWMLNLF